MSAAIRVKNLAKSYRIGHLQRRKGVKKYRTLQETLVNAVKAPYRRLRHPSLYGTVDEFWALQDINFDVQPGEVMGIIGRNGAGKSTLLKILSRITDPTRGEAEFYGRVGSLLEVGTGFHPELTGRENIYLNGCIMGMRRAEIRSKFDEIVDFSGVEEFLETPVKRYSSGMRVRLAFSVAAHLHPEILLIDEILAVGDAGFQSKCLGKMSSVARSGRTILFVSHNMAAVQNLCHKAMVIDGGRISYQGETQEAVGKYLEIFDTKTGSQDLSQVVEGRQGTGDARIVAVDVLTPSGEAVSGVPMGVGAMLRLHIDAYKAIRGVTATIDIFDSQGVWICNLNSLHMQNLSFDLKAGEATRVECKIARMNLCPGNYRLNIAIHDDQQDSIDLVEHIVGFDVVPSDVFGTGRTPFGKPVVFLDAEWTPSSGASKAATPASCDT